MPQEAAQGLQEMTWELAEVSLRTSDMKLCVTTSRKKVIGTHCSPVFSASASAQTYLNPL